MIACEESEHAMKAPRVHPLLVEQTVVPAGAGNIAPWIHSACGRAPAPNAAGGERWARPEVAAEVVAARSTARIIACVFVFRC